MSAPARWCYQHRLVVITAWIGLLIGLTLISQAVKSSYDNSFTLAGTDSGSAQQLLQRLVPAQAGDVDQIVWRVSHGSVTDPANISRVIAEATAAREPGLAVELGGQAISHSEQASLSVISAVGIGAAAVILLLAFGSLFAMALPSPQC